MQGGGAGLARNLWWLYAVPFAIALTAAEILRSSGLASTILPIAGFASAVIVLLVGFTPGRRVCAILLAAGLALSAGAQLCGYLWVSPSQPYFPTPVHATIMVGQLLQVYAIMRWLLARKLAHRSAWLMGLPVAAGVLAGWTVAVELFGVWYPKLDSPVVWASVRAFVDVALLMVLTQATHVTARRNRAFALVRYAFGLNVVASVLVVVSAYHHQSPHILFRPCTALALVLVGSAILHPDFARPPAGEAIVVKRGAFRLIEIATMALAVVVAPGFSESRVDVEQFVRLVVVVLLVGLILARSDGALRDLEDEATDARYRSSHDPLTGLPNQALLLDEIPRTPGDLALLHVAVAGLTTVGDSYGHAAGDEAVVQVADRIVTAVVGRGRVFRVAAADFAVLSASSAEVAVGLAADIRTAVAEPFHLTGARIALTATIGIAVNPDASTSPVELIREADSAVAHAAEDGRGIVVFDHRLRAAAIRRLRVTAGLRDALAAGAFELHYQPIVANETGHVAAYEALVRLRDGDRLVQPDDFMEVAEASGIILDIGDWLLDTAMATAAGRWCALPECQTPIAVNVSARQLRDPLLSARVAATLDRHRVPAAALWIELTETALISDTDNAARVLSDLAAQGIRICLDDFGVGYSALSHLSTFPISVVKIDKSFIAALCSDRDGDPDAGKRRVVVRGMVAMAEQLGVATVAEGVEDAALDARVRALGCTYSQGWYHGRPAPDDRAFPTIADCR